MYCNGRLACNKCIFVLYLFFLIFTRNEATQIHQSRRTRQNYRNSPPKTIGYTNFVEAANVGDLHEAFKPLMKSMDDGVPIASGHFNQIDETTERRINRKYHGQDFSKVLIAKKYLTPLYSQLNIPPNDNRDLIKHVKIKKVFKPLLYDDHLDRLRLENSDSSLQWQRLLADHNNAKELESLEDEDGNNPQTNEDNIYKLKEDNYEKDDSNCNDAVDELDKLTVGPKIDYALDYGTILNYPATKWRKSLLDHESDVSNPMKDIFYEEYCRQVDHPSNGLFNHHKRSNRGYLSANHTHNSVNRHLRANKESVRSSKSHHDNVLLRRQIGTGLGNAFGGLGGMGGMGNIGLGGTSKPNGAYPSVLTKAVEISINPSNKVSSGNLLENVAKKMNTSALQLAKQIAKSPDPMNSMPATTNLLPNVLPPPIEGIISYFYIVFNN